MFTFCSLQEISNIDLLYNNTSTLSSSSPYDSLSRQGYFFCALKIIGISGTEDRILAAQRPSPKSPSTSICKELRQKVSGKAVPLRPKTHSIHTVVRVVNPHAKAKFSALGAYAV